MILRLSLSLSLALALAAAAPATAMTTEERAALDLSAYVVTDPDAGYFDVAARRAALQATRDPALLKTLRRLRKPFSCETYLALPVQSELTHIPMLGKDREGWRAASEPYRDFEDAVSLLAAKSVIGEADAAGCLVKLLDQWAVADAFPPLVNPVANLQVWYQTESSLAAAALAYSTIRGTVRETHPETARIDDWLNRAARRHLAYPGGVQSCCNNHLYRRGLYASVIGVMTSDDELFRIGIAAIRSALSDSTPSGALPLEMARGRMAAHYQNFGAMYLALIVQVAARQGYDLSAPDDQGRTLATIFAFAQRGLENPGIVASEGVAEPQDQAFRDKRQYVAWLELLPPDELTDGARRLLEAQRPVYNRSLGGYLTLYFADPGLLAAE
jgi:poly(beta-D-mannuronate) lyase